MSKDWDSSSLEPSSPVPPLTKCIAVKDFKGEQGNDLPFSRGEVLTIIEPCNVMYWYLAENSTGRRGVIPITHVKGHQTSYKKPPALPPPSLTFPGSSPPPMDSLTLRETLLPPPFPPIPPKPLVGDLSSTDNSSMQKGSTHPRVPSHHNKIVYTHSNEITGSPGFTQYSPTSTRMKSPDFQGIVSLSNIGRSTSPDILDLNSPPPLPPLHPRSSSSLSPYLLPHSSGTGHSNLSSLAPSISDSSSARISSTLNPLSSHNSPIRTQWSHEYPPSLPFLPKLWTLPHLPPQTQTSKSAIKPPLPTPPEGDAHSTGSSPVGPKQVPPLPHSSHISGLPVNIDGRPRALLPTEVNSNPSPTVVPRFKPRYENQQEFVLKSGWFSPNLETVLCKMMFSGNVAALTSTTAGIYMFTHKHLQTKKYVAMSRTAYHDLVLMFHRLYEKNDDKLNSLEWEIKFNSPNASQWVFRIYSVANSEMLEVEANRRIILNNTLQPAGLNTEVMFSSKESFYNFAEVYAQMQRKNASKFINPIRQAT